MNFDWIGFFIIMGFGFLLTVGPFSKIVPKTMVKMLLSAYLVRIIGTLIRYWVIFGYYDGGDAGRYYRFGLVYADFIRALDFSFMSPAYYRSGHFWGTQAMISFSGAVLSVIGPTIHGEFLAFSILAFAGLLLVCVAYHRNFLHLDPKKYAILLLFCPSLWFWSSSVGKDSLILVGTCLVIYGYSVHSKRIRWIALISGLLLAGIIRPHVAGVLVVSVTIAHWLTPGARWTFIQFLQGLGIVVIALFVLRHGFTELGVEDIDVENIKGFVGMVSERSSQGGSAIKSGGFSITGIPMAYVNVLFRPFPWEIGSPLMAASALEVLFFWGLVIRRWRRVTTAVKQFRSSRILRFGLPFILLYTLMLGVAIGNMGILVRQRIHIIPLLLVWLEAIPMKQSMVRTAPSSGIRMTLRSPKPATGIPPEISPKQG